MFLENIKSKTALSRCSEHFRIALKVKNVVDARHMFF